MLTTGTSYGNVCRMENTQKITAHLPSELVRRAQAVTRKGLTETLRRGLDLLVEGQASDELRALRGKVHLKVDLASLRADRR